MDKRLMIVLFLVFVVVFSFGCKKEEQIQSELPVFDTETVGGTDFGLDGEVKAIGLNNYSISGKITNIGWEEENYYITIENQIISKPIKLTDSTEVYMFKLEGWEKGVPLEEQSENVHPEIIIMNQQDLLNGMRVFVYFKVIEQEYVATHVQIQNPEW